METKELSNRELVRKLIEAAPTDPAWPEFIARFDRRIRLAVYRTLRAESDRTPGLHVGSLDQAVEDLAQEVYVRLLEAQRKALASFEGRSEHSIHSYLTAIAVNLVRDHAKKLRALKKPRATVPLPEAVSPVEGLPDPLERLLGSDGLDPEQCLLSRELGERVAEALEAGSRDPGPFQLASPA